MISSIHIEASRLFRVHDALKLVPPPKNETVEDLRWHVRTVLGLPVTATMVRERMRA
jgi:hypothetical protein